MSRLFIAGLLFALALIRCGAPDKVRPAAEDGADVRYGYQVVNVYPHDSRSFTQGLVFIDGYLFESTGLYGHSTLRKVQLETGQVAKQYDLDPKYFGEGLTDWHGKLVQLTWETGVGFVYDLPTFGIRQTFSYSGEGWGLTHDASRLILSDGSATLRFLDPESFHETGRVIVRDRGKPVDNLNELEFVDGEIYANVWHSDRIARIAPDSGEVLGWIDMTGLLPKGTVADPEAVLNGIAYDGAHRRLFVTGKLWPRLFEVRLDRVR